MKRWIIITGLMLIGLCPLLRAEGIVMDSTLARELSKADDTTRLKLLFIWTENNSLSPDEQKFYADRLLEEALRQHNALYECEAYLSHMYMAFNNYQPEEVNRWMSRLEPVARREKLYQQLFLGMRCTVNQLIFQEQFELQEREALNMLSEAQRLDNVVGMMFAYEALSHNYNYTYRFRQSLDVLEKAYALSSRCEDKPLISEVTQPLIKICEYLKEYPKLKKYLQAQETLLKTIVREHPEFTDRFRSVIMMNYLAYMRYYLAIGDKANALGSLRQADEYYSTTYSSMHDQAYHEAYLQYYSHIRDWEASLREIDIVLGILRSVRDMSYYKMLSYKANLLAQTGREKEAIALYKEVSVAKDSLQIGVLDKQTRQIKKSYDTDRLLLDQETIQRKAKLALVVTLFILILVLVYFVLHILRVGKQLHRAKAEMGLMAHEVEQANQAKAKFLSSISTSIRVPLDEIVANSLILSSDDPIEPDERQRLSQAITVTAQRLMTMVNEILVLSKLEAGMMKLTIERLDVVAYLRSMVDTLAFERKTVIDVDFPENREYTVQVDVNYFSQTVSGLLAERAPGCETFSVQIKEIAHAELQLTVCGTLLASRVQTQESTVRNEINRMLTERFAGRYEIHSQGAVPFVRIILPVVATA